MKLIVFNVLAVFIWATVGLAQAQENSDQVPTTPGARIVERILVKVNGEIITQSDLEDRQVAAVDDADAHCTRRCHKPAKAGVELRRAAGEVDQFDLGRGFEEADDLLCRLGAHDLEAMGPGVHVAVAAGLVADAAEI